MASLLSSTLEVIKIRRLIAGLVVSFFALAECKAGHVQLSLHERSTASTKNYSVDTDELALKPLSVIEGAELMQTTRYSSVDRKLVVGNVKIADADDVLFQCELNGVDLVVVRVEYNSFGGLIRLLAAVAGHPIQVSKVLIFAISGGKIRSEKEITRKDSSYVWSAKIFH